MSRVLYGQVDPKCRELADYFLPPVADEITRSAMAQNVQDVVDDWLLDYAPPPPRHNRSIAMVTKATGSQGTKTTSGAGQNRPNPGGSAGAGKARGGATLSTMSKTTPGNKPSTRK